MTISIIHADCRAAMADMDESSIDAIVTDPPYFIESIVKRFGKPGSAPAKSDGATGLYKRTSDKFIGEEWDGSKIAFDPVVWAEMLRVAKPGAYLVAFGFDQNYDLLAGAIRAAGWNVKRALVWLYSTGAPRNRDVGADVKKATDGDEAYRDLWGMGTGLKPAMELICLAQKPFKGSVSKNLIKHGVGGIRVKDCANGERWPSNVLHDGSDEVLDAFSASTSGQSPVRFFYSAKANAEDRCGSDHPSVKPVSLMRWLTRLVTPPGGTVLDPFAGSGTTGAAAMAEGLNAILIEQEERYVDDIRRRISTANGEDTPLLGTDWRTAAAE